MPLPRVLGELELADKVGESAVGEVYRAHHRQTGRRSHVRILAKSYTNDEEAIRLAVASIHETPPIAHPNIGGGCMYVSDLAAGRVGDRVYLVFSTAQVLDLEALSREGPLPWSDVRWMMLDICCGLDAAHRLHYMHGDLQPGHCFLMEHDEARVRVTGFGLGKARCRGPDKVFLAPELRAGADPDPRSDVWGAASTMQHLLLGRPPSGAPYRDDLPGDVVPPWPREVDTILATALAPDPTHRYPTVRALASAIAAVGGGNVVAAMARFERPAPPSRIYADLPAWAIASIGLGGGGLLIALVLWLAR